MDVIKLTKPQILEYSKLVSNIISSIPYYSKLAKKDEIKKFSALNLRKNLQEKSKLYLYVIEKNKIAGFICGYFDAGTFWLEWVGVDKKFRNKDLASLMISHLIKQLKGKRVHKIWCDSRTNNKEIIGLFKKLGFRRITKIKNHWYKLDFYLWEKIIK
jgi:ribosomal protein S18 acetylase RimI-like enzyme